MMELLKTAAGIVGSAATVAALLGIVVKLLQPRAARAARPAVATSRGAARGF
jgi:hypothetical protein